jgi:DNA polymerase elongation subunit (family B)
MNLTNIGFKDNTLYLFLRNEDGSLSIKTERTFFNYYYEIQSQGNINTYDHRKAKRILIHEARLDREHRHADTYESDVHISKRFLWDKVEQLNTVRIKYAFLDIEILVPKGKRPDVRLAQYPVSAISIYNSYHKVVKSFFLSDYSTEQDLFIEFVAYLYNEQFDIWLSWNTVFDYPYLYNRYDKLFHAKEDFATAISPLRNILNGRRLGRWADFGKTYEKEDLKVWFPIGLSIVDYLQWYKKFVLNKRKCFTLDYILEFETGKGKEFKNVDFSKLSEDLKKRNIGDVLGMQAIEEKHGIITMFDDVRRRCKVEWEDLYYNSRNIEALAFQAAKNPLIALPNKPSNIDEAMHDSIQGAIRDVGRIGLHKHVCKVDLGSAYPAMISGFCLDKSNISNTEGISIDGTRFVQNENALMVKVIRQMIQLKKSASKNKKDNPDNVSFKIAYDAKKSLVNSSYGVAGNRYFRLYCKEVAAATTFLVRDCLTYIKNKMKEAGFEVVYFDTDSIFYLGARDITPQLNAWIQDWAKHYGKESFDLEFEFEGFFTTLLLLKKCRYFGLLNKKGKGEIEEEIKGMEIKRGDSSQYIVWFQKELIKKIFADEGEEKIIEWINDEKERIKTLPPSEISFPVKIGKEYEKTKPIFVRAYEYTKNLAPDFDKGIGELFWYCYVEPFDKQINIEKRHYNGRARITESEYNIAKDSGAEKLRVKEAEVVGEIKNVLAFDADLLNNPNIATRMKIDWDKMIDRNIISKCTSIFESLGWDMLKIEPTYKPKKEKEESDV